MFWQDFDVVAIAAIVWAASGGCNQGQGMMSYNKEKQFIAELLFLIVHSLFLCIQQVQFECLGINFCLSFCALGKGKAHFVTFSILF